MTASASTGGPPTRVGRYEILSHLATGGMANIYLAKAGGIGAFERYVVLKTISPERANDPRFVTMFLDEARLSATLNHQNIAQVYEVDEADGNLFITMEYVHGENLRQLIEQVLRKGWTIPVELAVTIVASAAAGLHHAHERKGKNGAPLNIVHRDVSPANIMVGYDGSVKLLDFGIAKAEERSTKTQQGTIKGKYGYMSPEQCRGRAVDRRSDVFALGIILYEITTLRRAFRGHDDFATMKRIVNGDLVPPSVALPGYPRELEAIVLTAMARDPEYRFQTTQEMLEALDAFMVRSQVVGSPSAMARFMTQLFGSRREPWVEASERASAGEHPPPMRGQLPDTTPLPQPGAEDDDGATTAVVEAPNHDLDTTAPRNDPTAPRNDPTAPRNDPTAPRNDPTDSVTQPTRTILPSPPYDVSWAPTELAPSREGSAPDAAAWDPGGREQQTRRDPPGTGPPFGAAPRPPAAITTPLVSVAVDVPRRAERASAPPLDVASEAMPRAGRTSEPPRTGRTPPPELLAPPRDAPQLREAPRLREAPHLLGASDAIPQVRANRTAMWILIAVLVAVIAVVAGTIALGLLTYEPRVSPTGPPSGLPPTLPPPATPDPAPTPAIDPGASPPAAMTPGTN